MASMASMASLASAAVAGSTGSGDPAGFGASATLPPRRRPAADADPHLGAGGPRALLGPAGRAGRAANTGDPHGRRGNANV